ncbi:MAG TPA: hypothetical protein VGQ59_00915, partial [Cyclobacteriaceae bacterium]|nr:hypothetical protein [Cyclobacteriaceae bacterium]
MKKSLLAFTVICASLSYAQSQNNCSLKKDHDGIKVYTCHTDTSRFKSIVAEFTINSSFKELIDFMMNVSGYTKWQFNTIESNVIKRISPTEQ